MKRNVLFSMVALLALPPERSSIIEIRDVDTTQMNVPDEARKKLS